MTEGVQSSPTSSAWLPAVPPSDDETIDHAASVVTLQIAQPLEDLLTNQRLDSTTGPFSTPSRTCPG
jgi:hypothetical protein